VDDLPPAAAGLEGVHGAEDAAAHDHRPLRVHGWIVLRARRGALLAGTRPEVEAANDPDGPRSDAAPRWSRVG
jgi:hypothetical protein